MQTTPSPRRSQKRKYAETSSSVKTREHESSDKGVRKKKNFEECSSSTKVEIYKP